jgi:hypothetical protein
MMTRIDLRRENERKKMRHLIIFILAGENRLLVIGRTLMSLKVILVLIAVLIVDKEKIV